MAEPHEDYPAALTDAHGRTVRYLRISVTDRCNLCCRYCRDDSVPFIPHENILRFEEIEKIIEIAVKLGVHKLRFTGGEPFARKGFLDFLIKIHRRFPQIALKLTSNGTLLAPALDTLKELSAALGNDPNFATTVATQIGRKVDKVAGKGLSTEDYTSEEKAKLAGISSGANNYRHPASHPASMIEQDATHRFITDTERSTWNGKASTAVATQSANGLMSSADKKKLDDLTDGEVIIQCSIPGMN